MRRIMAGATRSKPDSTTEVVDILNHAGRTSPGAPSKRKRGEKAGRRPIGRPAKRSRTANHATAAANGARITRSATGVKNLGGKDRTSPVERSTRLRNPKASVPTRKRESSTRMGQGGDVSTISLSHESAQPRHTNACGEDQEYSLANSAFHAVPSSEEAEANTANAPSRSTRSKVPNAAPPKQAVSAAQARHRPVRRLGLRPAASNFVAHGLTEVAAGIRKPARNLKERPQPAASTLAQGGLSIDADGFGFPSPDRSSTTKDRRVNVGSHTAVAPATKPCANTENPQRKLPNPVDHQIRNGERNTEEAEEEATCIHGSKYSGTTAAAADEQWEPPGPSETFEGAAARFECGKMWTTVWEAANGVQDEGDPETELVEELLAAMRAHQESLSNVQNVVVEEEEESVSESNEPDLVKLATTIGNLCKSTSQAGEREQRLIRDIYFHAVPQAVNLLGSILMVRAANDDFSSSALEELIMLSKAIQRLCERLHQWIPAFQMKDLKRSTINLRIKLPLKGIEAKYTDALSKLRTAEYEAEAKIQEKEFAKDQARMKKASEQKRLAKRQELADWVQKDKAERQRKEMLQSRLYTQESNALHEPDHEEYDIDALDLHGYTPRPASGFVTEATEDIPEPTKRVWQKEETMALLFLLQQHDGPDRYNRIQEVISKVSREIRKLGVDTVLNIVLNMPGNELVDIDLDADWDVLDDLGNMEVADIEQQAQYLKALGARDMESDIEATGDRKKWAWLSSV